MAQELKAIDDLYERRIRNGSDPYKIKLVDVRHPPVYLKSEVDAVLAEKDAEIAELKAKLQDHCTTCPVKEQEEDVLTEKDTEIRKLQRALYKACANWAKSERYTEATWHGDEHREELWANVQAKCRAKAEQYK